MIAPARAGVILTVLLGTSCGGSLMNLPAGPGEPAADASEAIAAATEACRSVMSIAAEAAVAGSVGGRRVRARLHLGLAQPDSARLEAVAPFGQPLFIFVARDGEASLLLTRENRILRNAPPEAVLEAIAGLPLDPAALQTTLTGCVGQPAEQQGRRLADDWRVVPDGLRLVYLRRQGREAPWRLVAAVHPRAQPEWRVGYEVFENGFPHRLRFTSADRQRFDLRLDLSQVEINVQLSAEAFEIRVPPTAEPMTLEELRENGPLGE
jgi:outer membrane lipoprotein-sorting protein